MNQFKKKKYYQFLAWPQQMKMLVNQLLFLTNIYALPYHYIFLTIVTEASTPQCWLLLCYLHLRTLDSLSLVYLLNTHILVSIPSLALISILPIFFTRTYWSSGILFLSVFFLQPSTGHYARGRWIPLISLASGCLCRLSLFLQTKSIRKIF